MEIRRTCVGSLAAALLLGTFLALGMGPEAQGPGPEQTTVTLIAVADATIWQGSPNENRGAEALLKIGVRLDWPDIQCGLVRFDLASALPPSATIDSARLELWERGMESWSPNPFPVSIAARFVTGAWDEMTVTWNTRPSTSGWETRTEVHWAQHGWHGWNATGFARAWQANPVTNYGLELCGIPDIGGYSVWYDSRETPLDQGFRPRLVVTYHLTGASPVRLPLVLSRR